MIERFYIDRGDNEIYRKFDSYDCRMLFWSWVSRGWRSCSLSSINHLDEITEEECKELIRNYYMVKELIK